MTMWDRRDPWPGERQQGPVSLRFDRVESAGTTLEGALVGQKRQSLRLLLLFPHHQHYCQAVEHPITVAGAPRLWEHLKHWRRETQVAEEAPND